MELIIGLPIIAAYLVVTVYGAIRVSGWARQRGLGWIKRSGVVLGVLLIAYAVPFGDHTVGYVYFRHLCEKEAGVKVYRTVSNVEGFWWWPIQSGDMALKYGYAFVEGGLDPERVRRYEIQNGNVIQFKATEMKSRYAVRSTEIEDKLFGVFRGEATIVDLSSGEKLAEDVGFQYRGGWILSKVFAGYGGTAALCHAETDYQKFIVTVLQPIHPVRK